MKKIRYKDVKPGDVLGIYIGNDVYAFMRLLWLSEGFAYLCEIFDYKGTELRFDPEILKAKRLMPIVNANWWQYLQPKLWRAEVVYQDDSFIIPEDEIRSVRTLNLTQIVGYNLDWKPNSNQMRYFAELIPDRKTHAELSKIHTSEDLQANPSDLVCEIRNRLNLLPLLSTRGGKPRVQMWDWLIANNVYFGKF